MGRTVPVCWAWHPAVLPPSNSAIIPSKVCPRITFFAASRSGASRARRPSGAPAAVASPGTAGPGGWREEEDSPGRDEHWASSVSEPEATAALAAPAATASASVSTAQPPKATSRRCSGSTPASGGSKPMPRGCIPSTSRAGTTPPTPASSAPCCAPVLAWDG